MNTKRAADVLFWILLAVSVGMFGLFLALVGGVIDVAEPGAEGPAAASAPPTTTEASAPAPAISEKGPATTAPAAPEETQVLIRATRGDCWIAARLGSEAGPVLAERLLARGETLRLEGERIWLSAGAAANIDVTVGGKPRDLPAGTVTVVLAAVPG